MLGIPNPKEKKRMHKIMITLAVGAVTLDLNHPQACWIWAVADNLRLTASNAVAVARELL